MSDNKELAIQSAAISNAVQTAKDIYLDLNKRALMTYYNLGELVAGLHNQYGSNSVQEFGKELAEQCGKDNSLSSSSLYRCRQFYDKHSKEDIEKMAKAGITWTQVLKTLPLPTESVSKAVESISGGQVPPHKLSEHAAVISAGDDSPIDNQSRQNDSSDSLDEDAPIPVKEATSKTDKSVKSKISKVYGPSIALVDLMGDIWLIAEDYDKLSDDAKEECKEELTKLKRCFNELVDMMQEASQKLDSMNI